MAKRPKTPPSRTPKAPRAVSPQKLWERQYLREWRKHRELSVEQLAAKADVSPGLISQIENRRSSGSPDSLEKLAKALKIEVGELLDVKPEQDGSLMRIFVADDDREIVRRFVTALKRDKS